MHIKASRGLVNSRWATIAIVLAALVVCPGCPPPSEAQSSGNKEIRVILDFALKYKSDTKEWATAADELIAWIKKLNPKELEFRKITNIEEAFVSPRDNEQYVIPEQTGGRTAEKYLILVIEATGKDGKKMVALENDMVREMSSGEIEHIFEAHAEE